MTRHLATLRCYRRGALLKGAAPPALVPPNGITRRPAVNRGLDCTLSRLGKSNPFEPSRPTPYQSLRGGGVRFVLKRSADNCYPPSPADWARVWVDYHWSRPLTGFSDGYQQFAHQMVPDLLAAVSRNRVVSQSAGRLGHWPAATRQCSLFRLPIPSLE